MLHCFKEKSWSVLLLKGYVLNNTVRAPSCKNCKSTTEVLVANHNNPNLLLYGCKDSKCKHRMLRIDLENFSLFKESVNTPDKSEIVYGEVVAPIIS